MDIRKLDDTLHASPQIQPEDVPAIASLGYRSIVSNRPDGEEPGQPTTDAVRSAAEAAGLAFRHVPVIGGAISPGDIADFRAALDEMPGPVFGYCRTGTRTTYLWALAHAGDRPAGELIESARAAGYDLSPLRPRLAAGKAQGT